ncbi:P-loop containing nucleoside triphosphate hydrolase protein [Flammula alnicola]|nr:P-loop containing nucleoside triphosphate hydrolase protein [Flammula alnicola]
MTSLEVPASPFSWTSLEGKTIIREIIEERVPQWSNGPKPSQVECWAHTLQKIPTILIACTGWGKTAAFFGAVLVLEALKRNPREHLPKPPPRPVALVVTPLLELGNAHAAEIGTYKLKAVSVNAETLRAAANEGRDMLREIRHCEWSIVILSAERLVSREIDSILRDEDFRKNLVVFGIDEVHVLVPWGKDFREAYRQIALLPKRLPKHTSLIAVTATLSAGRDFYDLLAALELKEGQYHCIRLSSERTNVRTIFKTLTHTLGGYQFPDIAWVFHRGVKAVIYCRTLDMCFRVAYYGWNQYPAGVRRLDNVRIWTSITSPSYNAQTLELFKNNADTSVIVATIAFGMGMDVRNITDVINLGLPSSLAALVQQNGRAGRDLELAARAWTYVEPSVSTAIQAQVDYQKKGPSAPKPNATIAKHQKHLEDLDADLLAALYCHHYETCLDSAIGVALNDPNPKATFSCHQANRHYPCSSCDPTWTHPLSRPTNPPSLPSISTAEPGPQNSSKYDIPLPKPLTKAQRANAQAWLNDFALKRWLSKDGTSARNLPHFEFWRGVDLDNFLTNFHLLRSHASLEGVLIGWQYLDADSIDLFELTETLNRRYDGQNKAMREKRVQKAAETRNKNKGDGSNLLINVFTTNISFREARATVRHCKNSVDHSSTREAAYSWCFDVSVPAPIPAANP